jgi:hypothetical protein
MAGTLTISTLSDGTNSTSSTNCIKGSARAWVAYNGSAQTIKSSYNVSSVTWGGAGSYTVNFTNAFADTNYCVTMSSNTNTSGGLNATYSSVASTSSVGVGTYSIAGGGAGAYRDTNGVYIACFSS